MPKPRQPSHDKAPPASIPNSSSAAPNKTKPKSKSKSKSGLRDTKPYVAEQDWPGSDGTCAKSDSDTAWIQERLPVLGNNLSKAQSTDPGLYQVPKALRRIDDRVGKLLDMSEGEWDRMHNVPLPATFRGMYRCPTFTIRARELKLEYSLRSMLQYIRVFDLKKYGKLPLPVPYRDRNIGHTWELDEAEHKMITWPAWDEDRMEEVSDGFFQRTDVHGWTNAGLNYSDETGFEIELPSPLEAMILNGPTSLPYEIQGYEIAHIFLCLRDLKMGKNWKWTKSTVDSILQDVYEFDDMIVDKFETWFRKNVDNYNENDISLKAVIQAMKKQFGSLPGYDKAYHALNSTKTRAWHKIAKIEYWKRMIIQEEPFDPSTGLPEPKIRMPDFLPSARFQNWLRTDEAEKPEGYVDEFDEDEGGTSWDDPDSDFSTGPERKSIVIPDLETEAKRKFHAKALRDGKLAPSELTDKTAKLVGTATKPKPGSSLVSDHILLKDRRKSPESPKATPGKGSAGNTPKAVHLIPNRAWTRQGSIDDHTYYRAIHGPTTPASLPPAGTYLEDFDVGELLLLRDCFGISNAQLGALWPQTFTKKGAVHDSRKPFGRPSVSFEGDKPFYNLACGRYILMGEGELVDWDQLEPLPWVSTDEHKTHRAWKKAIGKPDDVMWIQQTNIPAMFDRVVWPTEFDILRISPQFQMAIQELAPTLPSAKDASETLKHLFAELRDEFGDDVPRPLARENKIPNKAKFKFDPNRRFDVDKENPLMLSTLLLEGRWKSMNQNHDQQQSEGQTGRGEPSAEELSMDRTGLDTADQDAMVSSGLGPRPDNDSENIPENDPGTEADTEDNRQLVFDSKKQTKDKRKVVRTKYTDRDREEIFKTGSKAYRKIAQRDDMLRKIILKEELDTKIQVMINNVHALYPEQDLDQEQEDILHEIDQIRKTAEHDEWSSRPEVETILAEGPHSLQKHADHSLSVGSEMVAYMWQQSQFHYQQAAQSAVRALAAESDIKAQMDLYRQTGRQLDLPDIVDKFTVSYRDRTLTEKEMKAWESHILQPALDGREPDSPMAGLRVKNQGNQERETATDKTPMQLTTDRARARQQAAISLGVIGEKLIKLQKRNQLKDEDDLPSDNLSPDSKAREKGAIRRQRMRDRKARKIDSQPGHADDPIALSVEHGPMTKPTANEPTLDIDWIRQNLPDLKAMLAKHQSSSVAPETPVQSMDSAELGPLTPTKKADTKKRTRDPSAPRSTPLSKKRRPEEVRRSGSGPNWNSVSLRKREQGQAGREPEDDNEKSSDEEENENTPG